MKVDIRGFATPQLGGVLMDNGTTAARRSSTGLARVGGQQEVGMAGQWMNNTFKK